MNKIKRFGTIYLRDMTKEIEETINNDEIQMKKLYERIEYLEDELNKKNTKIKILEEENEAYKLQIVTYKKLFNDEKNYINNIDITKEDKKDDGPKLLNFNKMKEALKREHELESKNKIIPKVEPTYQILEEENNTNKFIPTPSISSDNSVNINYERFLINKEKFKIIVNKIVLNIKIKKFLYNSSGKIKECHDTNIPISKPKPIRKQRNKKLPAIERYPVTIYDKTNSEILNFVSEENKFLIKFQYKIAEKLDNKIEEITIKDIIDFKIKCEGLNDNKDQRKRLKFKIERCKVLYEKYGEKLSRVRISLNYLSEMPEKIWFEWLQSLDNIINNLYIDSIKCDYKYKNNKICGRYDCKIKHRETS